MKVRLAMMVTVLAMASGCVCYRRVDTSKGIDRKFPPGPLYPIFCNESERAL
ncbi:MAG: hypothetical protein HN742_10820 [Lentisphaerae bacterium]|nr:hypothetical protein [Lentisphaerota bacterium]MBT7056698.1 hypothetical protein [Lentisphaerota bacterium]MBT7842356.1 hypothetical protein [Lentisphaerota bacterium]